MLPAAPLTLVECLIAADWCDEHEMPEYAERLRDAAEAEPMRFGCRGWWGLGSRSASRNFAGWPHSESMCRSGTVVYSASWSRDELRIRSEDWSRDHSG